MPYTRENLANLYNIASEEVEKTLLACDLPLEQSEYNDGEIDGRFKVIRRYFDEGKVQSYEAAIDLLKQELVSQGQPEPNGKGKKSSKAKQKPSPDNNGPETSSLPPSREQIIQQIQSLMEQAGGLSGEEFAQLLPDLANQRQAELIEMFDRGLLARLSNMAETGELEQIVRQTSAGKKSLSRIPSLFLEVEVVEELPPSSPRLLSESSDSKSSS